MKTGKDLTHSEKFDTRTTVSKLDKLMDRVTEKEVTPQTVQAAVNCANTIVDILKIHIEVEKIGLSKRRNSNE